MQVITAIYLNCRPDLRDEWLSGIEVDDVSDAQVCLSAWPEIEYIFDAVPNPTGAGACAAALSQVL